MGFARNRKTLHRLVAGFMAVWLSGIVFLFCCEKMNGASKAEFCPLEKMTGHCNRSKASGSSVIETSDSDMVDCCGFLPIVFDKVRKAESGQSPAPPVAKLVVEPIRLVPVLTMYIPTRVFSRIESRQGTYLQNCNFRI